MKLLGNVLWIELRKSWRARVPLYMALGFLIAPLACAFMMFIAKDPVFARQAGLISAKANLIGVSADWPFYLSMLGQAAGAGGMVLFSLLLIWLFGREFADGTLKDWLAVPVERGYVILSKYIVLAIWAAAMILEALVVGFALGALLDLPQGSSQLFLHSLLVIWIAALLAFLVVLPFAFIAGLGRGYFLPIGLTILFMALANLVMVIGYGPYFPWAVPMLFAQGKSPLPAASFWIAALTGLIGAAATYVWWKYADQNR